MTLEKNYNLTFSKSTPLINLLLKEYVKTLPISKGLFVSKNLLTSIAEINKEIASHEIPTILQLAYINPEVNAGIFLNPKAKSIEIGTFIGIYTGIYELIESDSPHNNGYSYNIAEDLSLTPSQLKQVKEKANQSDLKGKHSIQTNAGNTGNFTRFINHSPTEANIKALLSKFPDGRIEILLFALKKINPGEQLLSNYGSIYWKTLHSSPVKMTPESYTLNSLGHVIAENPLLISSKKTPKSYIEEELAFKLGLVNFGFW